nr:unnamed protein product [Spirometra erinaceieuropaei]
MSSDGISVFLERFRSSGAYKVVRPTKLVDESGVTLSPSRDSTPSDIQQLPPLSLSLSGMTQRTPRPRVRLPPPPPPPPPSKGLNLRQQCLCVPTRNRCLNRSPSFWSAVFEGVDLRCIYRTLFSSPPGPGVNRESTRLQVITIFTADEDIQEGQLVIFLLLHRKLNVREDGVDMFFKCQHLVPLDDDEAVIHIPSQNFGLCCRKTSDSSRCRTASAMSPEIGEPIGVPFTCS